MQACNGGPIVSDFCIPRVLRSLQTFAPHYYKLVTEDYTNEHQRLELEAFDMELQEPHLVIQTFKELCYKRR